MRTPTFAPGSLVWIRRHLWHVERATLDHRVLRLDVVRGATRGTYLAPFDRPAAPRLSARPVRVRPEQGVARAFGHLASTSGVQTLVTPVTARIDLLAYQLEPALAARDGHRRLLIADAVGLGKTIQAGLIIAERLRQQPASRVIIVAPAGLREQWADELTSRFSISAELTDDHWVRRSGSDRWSMLNPWRQPGVWIVSIDYLKQAHVERGMPAAAWDVVVVDEAHMATGATARHQACSALVRLARTAVLLTATPHGGDDRRFSDLLSLGAHPDDDELLVFRRTRSDGGLDSRRHVRWRRLPLPAAARAIFDHLLHAERTLLRHSRRSHRDAVLLLLSVLRRRAVSTMAALERSLNRRLRWLDQDAGPARDEHQLLFDFGDRDDDLSRDDDAALTADIGLSRTEERRLLEVLRDRLDQTADAKLTHLTRLLSRTPEPVIVFTEYRDSLEAIRGAVERLRTTAVLHGGQTAVERRTELARFLNGEASVLVATDVGGQGLNMHTRARWIVSLEVPWNPTRLEQRIGRVDRLGQERAVHASILTIDHPAESPTVRALAQRVLIASHALGDASLPAVPDLLTLAQAAFDGRALELPPSPTPLPRRSDEWRRQARAQARTLGRRREWRSRWRSVASPAGRPVTWTSRGQASRALLTCGFRVSIADRAGVVLERHLLTLCAPVVPSPSEVAHIAAQRFGARVRRVTRLLRMRARRQQGAESVIAADIASRRLGEFQPGLFGQRHGPEPGAAIGRRTPNDRPGGGAIDDARSVTIDGPELLWIRRH
jgi:superfamily II DNA or RNA helicase